MKSPRRALSSNALPSRRDVLAALAAMGASATWFAGDAAAGPAASAAPDAGPPNEHHAVVLYPTMGRVVLVFPSPPIGAIHVYVDGKELPHEFITVDSSDPDAGPLPSSAPVGFATPPAHADLDAGTGAPTPSGSTRYGIYAEVGTRQIEVSVDGQGMANATANVKIGESIDVPVSPHEQMMGGVAPIERYSGGCCGGARAEANASARSPSLGVAAVALAALALRRRSNSER